MDESTSTANALFVKTKLHFIEAGERQQQQQQQQHSDCSDDDSGNDENARVPTTADRVLVPWRHNFANIEKTNAIIHKEELDRQRRSLAVEHATRLAEQRALLEERAAAATTTAIDDLRGRLQREYDAKLAEEMRVLQSTLTDERTSALASLREDLCAEHAFALESLRSDMDAEKATAISIATDEHSRALQSLEEELRRDHEASFASAMSTAVAIERRLHATALAEALSELRDTLLREHEVALTEELERQRDAMIADHAIMLAEQRVALSVDAEWKLARALEEQKEQLEREAVEAARNQHREDGSESLSDCEETRDEGSRVIATRSTTPTTSPTTTTVPDRECALQRQLDSALRRCATAEDTLRTSYDEYATDVTMLTSLISTLAERVRRTDALTCSAKRACASLRTVAREDAVNEAIGEHHDAEERASAYDACAEAEETIQRLMDEIDVLVRHARTQEDLVDELRATRAPLFDTVSSSQIMMTKTATATGGTQLGGDRGSMTIASSPMQSNARVSHHHHRHQSKSLRPLVSEALLLLTFCASFALLYFCVLRLILGPHVTL